MLLTMRKNHNLPSYVTFVDLVKAYDMANHNLLLDILEQYGAPPRFVSAIKQIYQDLVVFLKIEKEVVELTQSVGVSQGDNMAPVLFLFLVSAFAETLETEWKNAGIRVCMSSRTIQQASTTNVDRMLRHCLPNWTSLPSQQRLHCRKSPPPLHQHT
jgi:hypothetical protein